MGLQLRVVHRIKSEALAGLVMCMLFIALDLDIFDLCGYFDDAPQGCLTQCCPLPIRRRCSAASMSSLILGCCF